jgi:SAM-dependent methyltransferase
MRSRLPELKLLQSENAWAERAEVLSKFLRDRLQNRGSTVKVLEAGCGRSWPLDLGDFQIELTGIDTDEDALNARIREVGDIDHPIVGDLREVVLKHGEFDLIYSCEVLEHINGAESVLERFLDWLKPDGVAVCIFPDRDTVFGLLTRCSPHWIHVAYHKYIMGIATAGARGFGPYRTTYDRVISRRGMHSFCAAHGCTIALEYGRAPGLADWPGWFFSLYRMIAPVIAKLSFGSLAWEHIGLVYVIQKRLLHTPAARGNLPASRR